MQSKNYGSLIILTIILILGWTAVPVPAEQKEAGTGKMAEVNGVVITQKEYDMELGNISKRIAAEGKQLDDSQLQSLKKQVLENLIGLELLYQDSYKKGVKVEKKEVDTQLDGLKGRFPNEAEFQKELEKMGLSESDIRSKIEHGISVQRFIDNEFNQKIVVSEDEALGFYNSNPDRFRQPEQVKASHILIKVDPKTDTSKKEEALKEIEGLLKKAKAGEDFAALAKDFSQGPSSVRGGDLGYFTRGKMVKPFSDAAFAMKPGEVSNIVETRFGYHIIKVTDKKDESIMDFEAVKDRLQQAMKQDAVRKAVGKYIADLREKAEIKVY